MSSAFSRLRVLRHKLRDSFTGPEVVGLEARNFHYIYLDALWLGILNGVAGTFTSVFAVRLGAPDLFLGLMAAGPALITTLLSLPAAPLVQRYSRQRVKLVTLGRTFNRLGYLFFALMPFLIAASILPHAMVVAVFIMSLPSALISVAMTSMLAEVIPAGYRSQVISLRYALMGFTSTLTVLVSGKLLDLLPFPAGYQLLFFLAAATSVVSIYYFGLIQIPEEALDSETAPSRPRSLFAPKRWREALANLGQQRAFLTFLVAYVVFQWGIAAPGPLFPIFWVRNLHASDSWIGALAMAGSTATVLAYFPWGRFAARRGNRLVLVLCALGIGLYPIATALSPTVEPLLAVSLFGGIVAAGLNIAVFNVLLEVCPSRGRASYIAIYNALVNVSSFLGPLFGTMLSGWLGVVPVLFITGAIRLLGASLFGLVPEQPEADKL